MRHIPLYRALVVPLFDIFRTPLPIIPCFMTLCVVTGQGRVFYREHFALQIR